MRISCVALLCLFLAGPTWGQARDDFFNIESPQVNPITVARVGEVDFLLVANTPDHSVEIYQTDAANTFVARVPVGLDPVSVRYIPQLGRFYTANFLGDSVTAVALNPGTGGSPLGIEVIGTFYVGDEPQDITYYEHDAGGEELVPTFFVTFMNLDGAGWFRTRDHQPVGSGTDLFEVAIELPISWDCNGEELNDTVRQALKQPRTSLMRDGQLVTLATQSALPTPFDFPANCRDPQSILSGDLSNSLQIPNLGTTNFNMALASNGDVFVVGGQAQTHLDNEPGVAAAPTGFVKSMFYMVRDICGTPEVKARDVNLEQKPLQQSPQQPLPAPLSAEGESMVTAQVLTGPVAFSKALSQLTSVLPFEVDGVVTKVFFTAFGNDRLGIIQPDFNADPNTWKIRRRNIQPLQHPVAGPRGLALKPANGDTSPARLYVLNRLDNSVTFFNPVNNAKLGQFALQHDPTPPRIRDGQTFLYSATHSGTGFVSCASCHVDGRTDALKWDLATPDIAGEPIPPVLLDGVAIHQITNWPDDKGLMITQSLQGLLNWEVDQETQELVTNAPYHWRGDREDLPAFNPAFDGLMLGDELEPEEVLAFEDFVNSIQYGPNPKQPRDRMYSGSFGDPDTFVYDPAGDGSTGGQRGMKIFHTVASLGVSSCSRCHQLPEGSNNRITVNLGQPTESAATRGLFQKEAKRDVNGYSDPATTALTGLDGMLHFGFVPNIFACDDPLFPHLFNSVGTINSFINLTFEGTICPGQGPFCPDGQDLAEFVHEMDWGTGPLVGYPLTVRKNSAPGADDGTASVCDPLLPDNDAILDCMEDQSRLSNSGVSARGLLAAAERGWWFDPRVDRYIEEPAGTVLTRSALLGLVVNRADYLTFTASPLGSERRIAAPDGKPFKSTTPGVPPASLELLPMIPNTGNVDIPTQTLAWADLNNGQVPSTSGSPFQQESIFVHTLRIYQEVLSQVTPQFGLPEVRHEAPRKLRVAGFDIRPGSELHLFTMDFPDDLPLPVPLPTLSASGPLSQVPTRRSIFPLYPTDQVLSDGREVWETAVELEPIVWTMMLLGWEDAPGVRTIYEDQWVQGTGFSFPDPPDAATLGLFDPAGYNLHYVRVVNEDSSQGDATLWQPLTIQ
ncbi:MAG: hypothetical protein K0U98_00625 [Deltaproteobacteria bacterium]|nr:hypothetical protein [Deltaproteobacteria bacterium]